MEYFSPQAPHLTSDQETPGCLPKLLPLQRPPAGCASSERGKNLSTVSAPWPGPLQMLAKMEAKETKAGAMLLQAMLVMHGRRR